MIDTVGKKGGLMQGFRWFTIKGYYKANGGEKYITIGNFSNDLNTDTTIHADGSYWLSFSYHYIDDVCVSTDSLVCAGLVEIEESIDKPTINIFPNPSNNIVNLVFNENVSALIIYSMTGELIFQSTVHGSEMKLDVSEWTKGIYLVKLIGDETSSIIKLVVE